MGRLFFADGIWANRWDARSQREKSAMTQKRWGEYISINIEMCVAISVIEPYGQRKHVITSAFGVQWPFRQLNGLVNK